MASVRATSNATQQCQVVSRADAIRRDLSVLEFLQLDERLLCPAQAVILRLVPPVRAALAESVLCEVHSSAGLCRGVRIALRAAHT